MSVRTWVHNKNVFHGVRKKLREGNSEFYMYIVMLRSDVEPCQGQVKMPNAYHRYHTPRNRFHSPFVVEVVVFT